MRIVHYINQFFGQIGGETEAGHPLEVRDGIVGPGMALKQQIGDNEIVATIICGDNYFVENIDTVKPKLVNILKEYEADMLVAGPAFNAGRYGMACGNACQIANEELGIETVSGMFEENPGMEMYRKYAYIVPTNNNARGMKDAVGKMGMLIQRVAAGEKLSNPEKDGFFERGLRENIFLEKSGAERCVDMLLSKIKGEEFETELPMPMFEKFKPSPAIKNMANAQIIVMTSGGMVPQGNPHRLEACNCTKWKEYSLEDDYCGIGNIEGMVVHGGYDPTYGNEDGNRILPIDVMVELEKEGRIGKLYDRTFVTVGNGMGTDQAALFGDEIAKELLDAQIDGAILTST